MSELVLRLLKGNGTEEVSRGLSIGTELLRRTVVLHSICRPVCSKSAFEGRGNATTSVDILCSAFCISG